MSWTDGKDLNIGDYVEHKNFRLLYLGRIGEDPEPGWIRHIEKLEEERLRLRSVLRDIGFPGKNIVYCRDGHEEAVLKARHGLEETDKE